MTIIESTFKDKKLQLNAMMNSKACKDFVDIEMNVIGYITYVDVDGDGIEKTITSVATDDGVCFGSVSPNLRKALSSITEVFGEITPENPVKVQFKMEKSKNGRDFLNVIVL